MVKKNFLSIDLSSQPEPSPSVDARSSSRDIAVIGLAVRLADYDDLESFWDDLAQGRHHLGTLPQQREHDTETLAGLLNAKTQTLEFLPGAYLNAIDQFDPQRFHIAPAEAAVMDPEQRVFLETALRAVEHAGYGGDALRGRAIGVFVGGHFPNLYATAAGRVHPEKYEQIFANATPSNIATRLAFCQDWRGPAALIDTACSSGLSAVHFAVCALRNGDCEQALVGSVRLHPLAVKQGDIRISSRTNRVFPFDARADGTVGGEGAVALLLKPLQRAMADGDSVLAVIAGTAVLQDGHGAGMTVPNPDAQARTLQAAWADGRVDPTSIAYVETHGTGTELGDPIEVTALTQAFRRYTDRRQFCGLGAVKANFGHLDCAAGLLGLAKAVLMLQHGTLLPITDFTTPNPKIDFSSSPVYVVEQPVTYHRHEPMHVGVSSFGLSGINAHIVATEAPPQPEAHSVETAAPSLVLLSAANDQLVREYAALLHRRLSQDQQWQVTDVCATLAYGRAHLRSRLAFIVQSREELLHRLQCIGRGEFDGVYWSGTVTTPSTPESHGEGDRRTSLAALAFRFIKGEVIDSAFPSPAGAWRRLHLPPTPFDHQRCWLSARADAPTVPSATRPALSGISLLGACLAETPRTVMFAIPLTDSAYWPAAEHQLDQQATLVGMAFPAMCAAAAMRLGFATGVTLETLRWKRLLQVEQVEADTTVLEVVRDKETLYMALAGRTRDGQTLTLAEATVSVTADTADHVDLHELRNRLMAVTVNETPHPNGGLVQASERWQCRTGLWRSADGEEWLGELRLPDRYHADLEQLAFHPALLDVATCIGLPPEAQIPVGCARVELFHAMGTQLFSHTVRSSEKKPGLLLFDVEIYDTTGRLCARFEQLAFRKGIALLAPVWEPAPTSGAQQHSLQTTDRVMIIGTADHPLIPTLENAIQACGCAVAIHPLSWGEHRDVATAEEAAATALTMKATHVLWLPPTGQQAPHTIEHNAEGLLRFLQCYMNDRSGERLHLLTIGGPTWAVPGYADLTLQPEWALLEGIMRATPQEDTRLCCRYLDADASLTTQAILDELGVVAIDERRRVAWRQHQRMVCEMRPVTAMSTPEMLVVREGGHYLLTGGCGGIGQTLARHLAAIPGIKLTLLGRSALTTKNTLLLQALHDAGAQASYHQVDISHEASLQAVLTSARADYGPIQGIFHCAGVPGGGFLARKPLAEVRATWAPKVTGTQVLVHLTQADPVELFVLCSSLTALTGAPGQIDYTAANAYQDAVAHQRAHTGLPALAVNWPAWAKVGMAARAQVTLGRREEAIEPEDGVGALLALLSAGVTEGVVLPPTMADAVLTGTPPQTASPLTDTPPPAVQDACVLTGRPGNDYTRYERLVAQVWAEELGVKELHIEDDYYDLGGDSISAVGIAERLSDALGCELSLADILQYSTLSIYAAFIAEATSAAVTPPTQHVTDESYPLTAGQLEVYHAEQRWPGSTGYNLPELFTVDPSVTPVQLEAALRNIINRHEALRTSFVTTDNTVRQRVHPTVDFTLEEDFVPEADLAAYCHALTEPFNVTTFPLFRAKWLRTETNNYIYFDMHHLIADGMSIEVFCSDLLDLLAGKALPPITYHLRDYACDQARQRDTEQEKTTGNYWRDKFRGVPLLRLPEDHPRPSVHTFRGEQYGREIPEDARTGLAQLAAQAQVSPFVAFLTVLSRVFARESGQEAFALSFADQGRRHRESTRSIGMFAQWLPLSIHDAQGATMVELARSLRQEVAESMKNADTFHYPALLDALGLDSQRDRTPLCEVTVSYMNYESAENVAIQGPQVRLPDYPLKSSCKGDLNIFVREIGGQAYFAVEYYADVFSAERIHAWYDAVISEAAAITATLLV